jgi:Tol biopolymer transport system component
VPRRIIALALGALVLAVAQADAQSFGRNKVHYEDFEFQILQTEHFEIYYYAAEREASIQAGRMAERWYARLSHALHHTFKQRQPIVLYASHAQFKQTNVIPGFLGDGVGGVTEHAKGRVVLPFAAGLGETDHVLGHELVHAFQRDILRQRRRSISTLPLWFIEGMAEYLSVGRIDPHTAMWLRDSVEQNQLPRIDQLDDPRWFPYRYGQALWAYLAGRFGDDIVARCLKSKASGGAVGRLVAVTGVDARTLSKDWHEWIRQRAARSSSISEGEKSTAVISGEHGGGRLNVGPALSPDGRWLVFLSERDQYSIDIFLADAATGTIQRKLVQTAGDPHFESLQFIESAGAWDPNGRRFALAALSGGRPVLTILDMQTGAVEREIPIRDVDQLFSPTWSPDGRRIAFSALKGGLSDLYVLDLDSVRVRPLTSDPFADLQPSWSSDGRTIVFSTDRFSSSMETLSFGNFRLGAIEIESETIRELPSVPGAKNIDPHWSADGASIYFVADGGDISNVYRLAVASGELFQVTNLSTGISGVTALSPALSVAERSDRLAFSVYRRGGYEIHAMDRPVDVRVLPPGGAPTTWTSTAQDPPRVVATRPPAAAVAMPTFGLPDVKEFTTKPYRSGLSLDRAIQPYLRAGSGTVGGFLRGGVALSFGDMLGDQRVQTAIQVGKSVNDFSAQAAYVNKRSRWNWAIVGDQVPWLTGSGHTSSAVSARAHTLSRKREVFRQLHRDLSGLAIYPFSGAKRVELIGGVQSISFDRVVTTSEYSGVTGALLSESTVTTPASRSAMLVDTGTAFVYDTAVFGPTSPILGERSRFAVVSTLGSLRFTTVTADYRKYFMPIRPFTIAVRMMHVARYGSGAEDPRLLPLVWTLRDVVRGYGDAGPESTSLQYLTSSRMLVGNVELRFPISGLLRQRSRPGRLPLEALVFSDTGGFWTAGPRPDTTETRLRSVGTGIRLNVAAFVFEFDAVRPFDRPGRGWTFAFNLRPGF